MESGFLSIVMLVVVLFFSVILHEIAHGWTALKFGDPTAKYAGRLTLNPMPHIDLFGTILLPALLVFWGMPVFGWAKPVPVNFENLRPKRLGIFCVSIAGVATNFLIAVAAAIIFRMAGVGLESAAGNVIAFVILINISLGVFNLLPLPPLDGSRLILMWLPQRAAEFVERRALLFILLIFILLPTIGRPVFGIITTLSHYLID